MKRRIAATRAMLQRLRVCLSTVLILTICFFGFWALKLPYWYIDETKLYRADPSVLTIQGNFITPDYKIINLIRQTQLPKTQIFRLDTKELEKNISQLQSVKKVYIRRIWFPARLVVVLDERVPVFLLAPNLDSEPNIALSADGFVIDHDYLPFKTEVKAKKLLTYGVRDGKDEVWDKKRVEEIWKLTKALETYSNQEVKYIDLRNATDVYIMLSDYLIRFGEINDTALTRAKYIASILPEAKKMTQKIKYIDLRWEDARYFCLKEPKENKEQTPSKTILEQEIDKPSQTQQLDDEEITQSQYIEIPDEN